MISAMLILVAIGTIVIVTDYWIDRIVTRKRVAENQRAWNEYSKGMTYEEKCEIYFEWCTLRKIENGWSYYYFPSIGKVTQNG